jgi:hypothetical protein
METDYERRLRETLAALSGGKVTEMPSRPAEGPPAMTTGEMLRATTLSGTHTVRRSTRGSWEPNRTAIDWEPTDWKAVAWPRDERGRFVPLEITEVGYDD